jgi:hypothetical protein
MSIWGIPTSIRKAIAQIYHPFKPMNDKAGKDELRNEINRGNFLRAALLAASLELSEKEIRDLQFKAVWQMAAENRNAIGTKKLAQQYGFTKKELREFLENSAKEMRDKGNDKPLKACYDYSAGKYLRFEEWLDHCFNNWNKLPS